MDKCCLLLHPLGSYLDSILELDTPSSFPNDVLLRRQMPTWKNMESDFGTASFMKQFLYKDLDCNRLYLLEVLDLFEGGGGGGCYFL